MNLQLGAEEEQIVDTARKFLSTEWPIRNFRNGSPCSFDLASRKKFAEMGWFGVGLPETHGGAGFSVVEESLFYREMGRALGPTAALSIALAIRIGLENENLTKELVAGEHGVAFCVSESTSQTGDTIRGRFRVIDIEHAAYAILFSGDRAVLFEIGSASVELRPCLDKSVSMAALTVEDGKICGSIPLQPVSLVGRLYVAAMLVGISEMITDMLVEYAKLRETFGKPIGSYQAVRHPCADMAVRTEAARAQLFYASVALREQLPDASLHVNAAKHVANTAAILNVDSGIQLHGGIATTDDHTAHLFMKRAHLLSRWLGDDRTLVREILNTPTHGERKRIDA